LEQSTQAVIDLGTNTFHLLVAHANKQNGTLVELARERIFVKLAEEGIVNIGPAAFKRGMDAMYAFRSILDQLNIPNDRVRAFGTAALRTAKNGSDFVMQVERNTGIKIQLISGNREALAIHKGVSLLIPPKQEPHLIMDIGGGSVEFIIADEAGVKWYGSFPVGVAVLHKEFYAPDPISSSQLRMLERFLHTTLQPLAEALSLHPVSRLVGASGTFDVLGDLLATCENKEPQPVVLKEQFIQFHQSILPTTIAERRAIEGMPENRADMILVALALINTVLSYAPVREILASSYALKEGMLYEMFYE
jgi:exopolyphosphatase/guanosine-5'-triphosphate,3'-diphosphate pyrophosphatase